jgi:NADH-quinone oxidoreductase subunit M
MSLSTIILTLFVGSFLTYFVSRYNKSLGGYATVAVSMLGLIMIIFNQDYVGMDSNLFFMNFKLSTLGWYFALVMAIIYSMSSYFNPFFMDKLLYPSSYNLMYLLSFAGTIGLFFAKDLLTLFIFWEIAVWSSTFIIPQGKSRRASVVYYTLSSIGSMATLFVILFVYSKYNTFIIQEAFIKVAQEPTLSLILFFTFILSGLTKIGIFPFHIWLPLAHGSAPHTFSPVLSGGLVKMGAFIAYISVAIFPAYQAFENTLKVRGIPLPIYLLMVLGAISIVIGTLMAIRQEDAKKLLAYSSVANGGYILIGILMRDQVAMAGSLLHLFNHAIASAAAFLAIAAVAYRTGTTKMSELGGMIHRMPLTYTVYLIAIISLAGIPPMGGFVSKWLIIQGVANKGLLFIAFAIFFGSIGSFLYVFRPLSAVFLGQLSDKHKNIKEVNVFMMVPMIVLSILTLFIGVLPRFVLEAISQIQISDGIKPVSLNGMAVLSNNGILNSLNVFVIFGFGFLLALIIFILAPKARKVDLMDTFTSAEFIHTPELLHYSHDFYAPFERLYKNSPDTEKFLYKFVTFFEEMGNMVRATIFSLNTSIPVLWIMVSLIVLFFGGARI